MVSVALNKVFLAGQVTRDYNRKLEEQEDGSAVHFRTLRIGTPHGAVEVRVASAMLPALEYVDCSGHWIELEGHLVGSRMKVVVDRVLAWRSL